MLQGVTYSFPSYKQQFKLLMDTNTMAKCYLYYNGSFLAVCLRHTSTRACMSVMYVHVHVHVHVILIHVTI